MGQALFPQATRLMITANAGGSNGPRVRAWTWHLARVAAETGLTITVCHYPPGTSKWNKIEHRLVSFISMNWQGRSLTDIAPSSSSSPPRRPRPASSTPFHSAATIGVATGTTTSARPELLN
jgi:Rhodopirellula transposase DDE domain